jgi:hypothetical protein
MAKGHDMNGDGNVTSDDLALRKKILDLENNDKRQDQQRRMSWVAMAAMVIFTSMLFTPWISPERIEAVSNLLGMFYIAQAGIVASFFGAQAFMTVNKPEE